MNSRENPSAETRFYRVLMGKYFQAVLYMKKVLARQIILYRNKLSNGTVHVSASLGGDKSFV